MAVLLVVIGLVVAFAAAALILNARRQTAPVAAPVFDDFEEVIISEPLPTSQIEPPVADTDEISWTKQFEPRSGELSDEARLRLINDLGLLRAPWCVPLLAQAYEEEVNPAHRVAAQVALARCREARVV